MELGTIVEVNAYGGEVLKRRVVDDLGKTIVVCNEAEFQKALKEKRQPSGIGFPRDDVFIKRRG